MLLSFYISCYLIPSHLEVIFVLSKAYSGDLFRDCLCNGTESAVVTRLEKACVVAVVHSQ